MSMLIIVIDSTSQRLDGQYTATYCLTWVLMVVVCFKATVSIISAEDGGRMNERLDEIGFACLVV